MELLLQGRKLYKVSIPLVFFQTSKENRVDVRLEMWAGTTQEKPEQNIATVIKRREWIQELFRGLNRLYLETNWMWDDQLLAWVKMEDGEDMRSVSVTLCFRQQ